MASIGGNKVVAGPEAFKGAVGRWVANADFPDDSNLRVTFSDGSVLLVELSGDCCSHSYFTEDAVSDAKDLVGGTVVSVEERDSPNPGRDYPDEVGGDTMCWHFLVFATDRGHVTLDWRNESNGYYDGTAEAKLVVPSPQKENK